MGEMNQTRIVFFHMLFDQSLPPSFGTFFTYPPRWARTYRSGDEFRSR